MELVVLVENRQLSCERQLLLNFPGIRELDEDLVQTALFPEFFDLELAAFVAYLPQKVELAHHDFFHLFLDPLILLTERSFRFVRLILRSYTWRSSARPDLQIWPHSHQVGSRFGSICGQLLEDVEGLALALDRLWEEPGHARDHHANLDTTDQDRHVTQPVLVLLAIWISCLHAPDGLVPLLALLWIKLFPEVERTVRRVLSCNRFHQLWNHLLFNEIVVRQGGFFEEFLLGLKSHHLRRVYHGRSFLASRVHGIDAADLLPHVPFKVSLLKQGLGCLVKVSLIQARLFLGLLLVFACGFLLVLSLVFFKGSFLIRMFNFTV